MAEKDPYKRVGKSLPTLVEKKEIKEDDNSNDQLRTALNAGSEQQLEVQGNINERGRKSLEMYLKALNREEENEVASFD